MSIKILDKKVDERGWLAEILRAEDVKKKEFGQVFVTVANPGVTKGGHYHTRKREYFCVIKGQADLELIKIDKNENELSREIIKLSENDLKTVELEPWVFHSITNTGTEDMVLLAYVDEVFNPEEPDTIAIKKWWK